MTAEEWILFISFNVVINVVLQTAAWKFGYRLATNQRQENKMPNMKEMTYGDLEYGDEFKINPDGKQVVYDIYGHRTLDRRWFRKTNDGALEIIDCFGDPCEAQNYRVYCYLTMPVYVREDDDESVL